MSSDENLWNAEAVGKYLNVSKDTIYRWIETKQMPALKVGKKWLFCKEEVDAWLNSLNSSDSKEDK